MYMLHLSPTSIYVYVYVSYMYCTCIRPVSILAQIVSRLLAFDVFLRRRRNADQVVEADEDFGDAEEEAGGERGGGEQVSVGDPRRGPFAFEARPADEDSSRK